MQLKEFKLKPMLLKAIIPCAIILITLITYSDVRYHQYLSFDDYLCITENKYIQNGFSLEGIRWAFSFTGVSYWPLTWMSHMLDCQLFGLAPGQHHMVNVAIHILNALFLFLILFRITGARYKAALIATLFAVHPLNVESVAWVAERKNVLCMLFFMIALYVYAHYAVKKKIWMYCFVLFAYALGLLSKPSIVIFPFLLLILDYWPLGRCGRGNACHFVDAGAAIPLPRFFDRFRFFRKSEAAFLVFEKVPFIILSLISFYLSMISMSKFDITNYDLVPLDLRIYNLFVSIMKYLWNMVLPLELSIYYPFPKSIPVPHFLLALLFVILITVMTFLWRKKRPWLLTGWCWFLIALAPASGLIQAGLWPEMANRYMYIPMIGLFLMLVWECDERIKGRYSDVLKVALCFVLLVYCISLTKVQNFYYSNSYAIFTRAAEVTKDNFVAYYNIGCALLDLNRVDEAKIYFAKAIATNPKYYQALHNYGVCWERQGDRTNAGLYFSRAIDRNPKYALAYANLGWNQYQTGHTDEAIITLGKALILEPKNANAHNALGAILMGQGKTKEAIPHFQIALKTKPGYVEPKMNLAQAYEKAGYYDLAIIEYKSLCEMAQTDKGIVNYRIAGVFARQNKFEECLRYLEISLKHGFHVVEYLKSDEQFKAFRKTAIYAQFTATQKVK